MMVTTVHCTVYYYTSTYKEYLLVQGCDRPQQAECQELGQVVHSPVTTPIVIILSVYT